MSIWLSEIWQSWRASLRRPGFLLLTVGVLALGVAASVTVFTLIDRVLLKPLPYPAPEQLAAMGPLYPNGMLAEISPQQYQHIQSLQGVQSMGLIEGDTIAVNIAGDGEPLQAQAFYADRSLLPTLGVSLRLGRNFSAEEDRPGSAKVVILSESFWQRRYGGDPKVLGRSMLIEGVGHVVIGVLPPSFDQFGIGDVMLPTAFPPNVINDGGNYIAVARLREGVAPAAINAQLDAQMHAMYAGMGGQDGESWRNVHFGVAPLPTALNERVQPVMMLFLASALFVLVIALVNLTNLMLLRALSRNHDAAVRNALGASTARLALPAFAEGGLIGFGGALLGLGLSMLGLALFTRFMPAEWTHGETLHPDASACFFAFAVGLLGALLTSVLGIWRSRALTSIDELREGGRSAGRSGGRLGRVLVVAQISLATCMLCGAGLFLHALYDAERASLGFSSAHILTFELAPVRVRYPDSASVNALSLRLLQRLRTMPGVESAAATTNLPAGDGSQQFNIGGIHAPGGTYFSSVQFRGVSADFFTAFRLTFRAGRAFSAEEADGGEPVAVINETLAQSEYGGNAVGKVVVLNDYSAYSTGSALGQDPGSRPVMARIVGVVGDTRQFGPLDMEKRNILYVPLAQVPDHIMRVFRGFEPMRYAIRVHGDPNAYRDSVRAAVAEIAPGQPIASLRTMDDIVHSTTDQTRLNLLLVGLFALLALSLASVGIYAVMAVAVTAREREFGVRLALGATPRRVMHDVLQRGLLQIATGLVLGLGLSLLTARMANALLEQIGRNLFDPPVLLAAATTLALAGLLACLLPAIRAGRTQPITALRGE
ncbi:ADOP family duplicated permease [Dyella subtropica]|uniref:ADOP family duplicated permease n=1 Tax=Dyella subtropica TaxID=2992127 RepID=UPI002254AC60|nr:ADOP family duplicated permease [Dyella subtropica]